MADANVAINKDIFALDMVKKGYFTPMSDAGYILHPTLPPSITRGMSEAKPFEDFKIIFCQHSKYYPRRFNQNLPLFALKISHMVKYISCT